MSDELVPKGTQPRKWKCVGSVYVACVMEVEIQGDSVLVWMPEGETAHVSGHLHFMPPKAAEGDAQNIILRVREHLLRLGLESLKVDAVKLGARPADGAATPQVPPSGGAKA